MKTLIVAEKPELMELHAKAFKCSNVYSVAS